MDTKGYSLHVLMFPWLAHGHISPFLELAKKLSQYNFYIYFCSTPISLCSIKDQISTKTFPSIELVEINLPSLPNLPPHYHTTKSLPSHLMSTLKEAFDASQPSFSDLLVSLKPDVLIYDFIQPWAPEIASHHNIPAINFLTMSAAASSYLCHMCMAPNVEFPLPNIYYQDYDYRKMSGFLQSYSNNKLNGDRFIEGIVQSSGIVLIKTSKEIEHKYIEQLQSHILGGMEILPVGVLVKEEPMNTSTNNEEWEYFMSWLDKKDQCSTVFVSFGSEYFMPREEIEEIARGLELSGVSFIWVIRFHEGEKTQVEQVLPQGFLDRVRDRGLVVEGWAPQVKILQHPSIGGFVSHLGWSSVMEGVDCGVPLIAMPMQLDQPLNARLVVDELGVGVEVKRTNEGKVDGEEISQVIKQVVLEKGGEEVKKQMKEISEKMRGDREIELVVEKLMKLCHKSGYQVRGRSSS